MKWQALVHFLLLLHTRSATLPAAFKPPHQNILRLHPTTSCQHSNRRPYELGEFPTLTYILLDSYAWPKEAGRDSLGYSSCVPTLPSMRFTRT
ncbi:hypothetical protein FA15DRAFT_445739 [Coprinopsis marcescibilis]|uniref:Secreted protein n=1 Tax=Coprinopsis marcescibilis TaxID=230819 RepID=A0A5C3KTM6_COPMA|nr:hypothetical protein FA15DRAFT_445739 [Coprinopsis marcescibilis]